MKRYETSTPRVALGAAAAAMTAITMAAMVFAPAEFDLANADSGTLARAMQPSLINMAVAAVATESGAAVRSPLEHKCISAGERS